jgi:hypothetical protein
LLDPSFSTRYFKHAFKRSNALVRYANFSILSIDTNPVGNAIRPIDIGKKRWLFVGQEHAGRCVAIAHPASPGITPRSPLFTSSMCNLL